MAVAYEMRAADVTAVRRHTHLFLITAFVAAALLVFRPAPARPSGAMQAGEAGGTRVTVVMKEFRFVLSTRTVRVGAITFRLVNRGRLAHDIKIAGRKSARIAPGKRGLLRVVFRRAGRYPYRCTVPGHAAAGMKGVLKVTR